MLATLAEITGQSFDPTKSPDSFSIVPLLDGKAPDAARDDRAMILISGGNFPGLGVRHGPWMFIRGTGPGGVTASGKLKPGGTGYAPYEEASISPTTRSTPKASPCPKRPLTNSTTSPAIPRKSTTSSVSTPK